MKRDVKSRSAIALLITVFFIMLITLSVGVGLKYINNASKSMQSEQFVLQSSMILDDVLKLLESSGELKAVTSADALAIFLAESSFIPFESNGVSVVIEISSARDRVNPNTLTTKPRIDAFKDYLILKMVNMEYADMLSDVIGGIKEDMSYNTDIFNQKPYLFRDYIASAKHLQELNDSYLKRYHENSLENIDMDELFHVSRDKNSSLDLNYATSSAWELMLGCNESRAEILSASGGTYAALDDLALSEIEKVSLNEFKTSFFEPYIYVKIEITQKDSTVNIAFEYDIQSKKGSNFVFDV